MSIRTKSVPKMKTSQFPKQKLDTARSSIKKVSLIQPEARTLKRFVTKAFNSPSQNKKKNPSIKTLRLQNSPTVKNLDFSLAESEISNGSLEKFIFLDQPSEERPESQVFPRKVSLDVKTELQQCQKQNFILQAKIEKLSRKLNPKKDVSVEDVCWARTRSALGKREDVKLFETGAENHLEKIEELKQSYQQKIASMQKELEKVHREELNSLAQKHEIKLKDKISELEGEYERKLSRKDDENIWLKNQNEKLKQKLEDLSSKLNLKETKFGNVFEDNTNNQNKRYNEIFKQYTQLQESYLKVKEEGLCHKCKALKDTNSEITHKINRIRAYIDSKN